MERSDLGLEAVVDTMSAPTEGAALTWEDES